MPVDRLNQTLAAEVRALTEKGTAKGEEAVVVAVRAGEGDRGPRVRLAGHGERDFLRMNSNSYLGLSLRDELLTAEENASRAYGVGPGAVRFISGTCEPHVELERALAEFHGREAAMIFSSAYATTLGAMVPLITSETVVISDALNHNCIINAMRLARPQSKSVYAHSDVAALESELEAAAGTCRRVIVVTDGIFSMRGDHAPLAEIRALVDRYDERFPENAILMVDDSHGVGAFGATGRGVEEYCSADGDARADVLVGTLGKAFGVNGGYVTTSEAIVRYLRETAPLYIYSNPITAGEASAALAALRLLDSEAGRQRLDHLRSLTTRFETGLVERGFETIPGEHPVVPLMVRDTERTAALVAHLRENGILATGLNFPVVPKGDEEIRFQINADHTEGDVDLVLEVLGSFETSG